jgi:hypothetical protein
VAFVVSVILDPATNVNVSKVVLNENGGIAGYYCKYIDKSDQIGVLHHTLLFESEKYFGKHIELFFNSNIVRFIFLITQYASGKMTINEKLVANSITIPPIGVTDYYNFFGIEDYKEYIEDALAHYTMFKAPKRLAKTEKAKTKAKTSNRKGGAYRRYTRKLRRKN